MPRLDSASVSDEVPTVEQLKIQKKTIQPRKSQKTYAEPTRVKRPQPRKARQVNLSQRMLSHSEDDDDAFDFEPETDDYDPTLSVEGTPRNVERPKRKSIGKPAVRQARKKHKSNTSEEANDNNYSSEASEKCHSEGHKRTQVTDWQTFQQECRNKNLNKRDDTKLASSIEEIQPILHSAEQNKVRCEPPNEEKEAKEPKDEEHPQ